jgi:hypothetical protein
VSAAANASRGTRMLEQQAIDPMASDSHSARLLNRRGDRRTVCVEVCVALPRLIGVGRNVTDGLESREESDEGRREEDLSGRRALLALLLAARAERRE